MRFMLLIKSDEQTEAAARPTQALMEAMVRYNDDLVNAGVLLVAEGLHSTSQGALIKFSDGKPAVTDGPFAEAKEIVAGFWIIRAQSKQAAIEWAKRIPIEAREFGGRRGGDGQVEVRQIFELEDFPVNENESGWREAEARFRAASGADSASATPDGETASSPRQFIVFRMADRNSEAGIMPSEELLAAMGAYNDELIQAGVMLAGEGLQPSSKGARVYYSMGRRTVVDGPFVEGKDLIAGFTMIRAGSKQEALEWARRWPAIGLESEVELQLRQVFSPNEFGAELAPELREAEERQHQRIAALQWPPDY